MGNVYFTAERGQDYGALADAAFNTIANQVAQAGTGDVWVLPPRTTAEILAYATVAEGMLCQASDTGLWWHYYNGAWQLLDTPRLMAPLIITGLIADAQASAESNTTYGGLTFANAGAWAWADFEAWLDGVDWRFVMEGLMTTGSASGVGINVAYLVVPAGGVVSGLVKTRCKRSTAYALNDLVIPATPNGHYYKCTTAGTTGASVPTWNTGSGSTTTDGTAVFTEQGASFKNLALTVTAPATAYQRFDVDSSSLQIPASEVAAGDRVIFGVWRASDDAHAGDLVETKLAIQPVEV